MSRVLVVVMLVLSALAWSSRAHAQDFVGTRALGVGEAYRAIATGNDAIYMNPAGLTVIPRYSPEIHYHLNLAEDQHEVDGSVVDSKTSPFAVGVAYTFDGSQFTQRASIQHTATLAVAYPFLAKLLSVGVGLKYANLSDAFAGNYLNAFSADVGMLSILPGGVSIAAVGYNLVPIKSARLPISAGFAAAWDLGPLSAALFGGTPNFGSVVNASGATAASGFGDLLGPLSGLTLAFDWKLNFATLTGTKNRLSGGVEYLLADAVPFRAGYLWDEEHNDQFWSVGTGFIVPYFGLDLAYQQSALNPSERIFGMSLKFFLTM